MKYIFFDKPSTGKNGPARHFDSALDLRSVRVVSSGNRATINFSQLSAGPFAGELKFHLYAGSPFLQIEAAMRLTETNVAFIHDALLDGDFPTIDWKDLQDRFVRLAPTNALQPVAVRNRTIMAEDTQGTVAVFPPPHAFFFLHDYSVNYKFTQVGNGRFGLRQDPVGGSGHEGALIPWFDAPRVRNSACVYDGVFTQPIYPP